MLAKAAQLPADQVFLDLEDAVSPLEKEAARGTVVDALNTHDYSGKTRVVRINGVQTQWCLRDVIEVVTGAGHNLDCIMVPKVEDAATLHFIDHLLGQLEHECGIDHRIGIEAQIESAKGTVNLQEIATATDRIETLIFGPGDYAANIGVARSPSVARSDVSGRPVALRDLGDRHDRARPRPAGHRRALHRYQGHRRLPRLRERALSVGFDGKWVLHPGQIDIANEVFMPTQEQFDAARRLLDAYHHATQVERKGAVMHEGQMIDEASRKIAVEVVARGEAAGLGVTA